MSNYYKKKLSLNGLDTNQLGTEEIQSIVKSLLDDKIHGISFSPYIEGQGPGTVIDAEQINALLSDTLRRIESEFDDELPSRAIADAVMHGLRTVDSIAWLRYASFYEDFTQFSRFAEEILYLGGERAGENSGG